MHIKTNAMAKVGSLLSSGAGPACAFWNTVPLNAQTADPEVRETVTRAMADCGRFEPGPGQP